MWVIHPNPLCVVCEVCSYVRPIRLQNFPPRGPKTLFRREYKDKGEKKFCCKLRSIKINFSSSLAYIPLTPGREKFFPLLGTWNSEL